MQRLASNTEIIETIRTRRRAGEEWLIGLDRDGTLVPYARRPEEAEASEALKEVINRLCSTHNMFVAIVSARSVALLRGDFGKSNIILAGNYGMEIRYPDGQYVIQPAAKEAMPRLKKLRDHLARKLDDVAGVVIEDHGFSICVHWKLVPHEHREQVKSVLKAAEAAFPDVKFRGQPTSNEALPKFEWTKAMAYSNIAESLPWNSSKRNYFFAGDSFADEAAFSWVNASGGISVKVGSFSETEARFHLPKPEDLLSILAYMLSD